MEIIDNQGYITPPHTHNGNNGNLFLEKNNTYTLRGICMIIIVAHHIYQHAFNDIPYLLRIFWNEIGWIATGVFFFLSGFGLWNSIKNNEPIGKNYCKERLIKLLSPFLFEYLIFIIYFVVGGELDLPYLLRCLFTLTMPTTVSWFFKVITGIYVVTLITSLLRISEKKKLLILFSAIILYFTIARLTLVHYWSNSVLNFLVGLLCVYMKEDIAVFIKRYYWLLWVFALGSLAFSIGVIDVRFISNIVFSLLIIYTYSFINTKSPFLIYCGRNSLCLYLFEMFPLYCIPITNRWLYGLGVFSIIFTMTGIYTQIEKFINNGK